MSEVTTPKTSDQEMITENTKESDTDSSKVTDELKDSDSTNDGVKILEEVFGKASVGDKEEDKLNMKEAVSFGPVAPTEDEFDEEEIKKAEEFKT